jgi:hypothetical protein
MGRPRHKVSTAARCDFSVYDSNGDPVTGLVNGDFTKLLSKDGVDDATSVTVSEIGSGRYSVTFTPASVGIWTVTVRNSTYDKEGWQETFDVTSDGLTFASYVETGYDLARTLRNIAAACAGKVSGLAGGAPVFRNQGDTTDQITATTDADGNRTAVTHGA